MPTFPFLDASSSDIASESFSAFPPPFLRYISTMLLANSSNTASTPSPVNAEVRINDRIVSLNQPHVRPIVRGKAGKNTEFGAKLSASCIDGYVFLHRISWDNYNE